MCIRSGPNVKDLKIDPEATKDLEKSSPVKKAQPPRREVISEE